MIDDDVEIVESKIEIVYIRRVILPYLYSPIKELRVYFEDNSFIFTLIGVFGAISIYSSQIIERSDRVGPSIENVATVTGFSIIVLLSLVSIVDLFRRIFRGGFSIKYKDFGLLAFGAFFIPLITIVANLLSQFPTIWKGYYFFLAYPIGLFIPVLTFITATNFAKRIDEYRQEGPHSVLVISIISLIGSMLYLAQFESPPTISGEGFSLNFAVNMIVFFSILGFGIVLLMSLLIASVVIIAQVFKWAKRSLSLLLN